MSGHCSVKRLLTCIYRPRKVLTQQETFILIVGKNKFQQNFNKDTNQEPSTVEDKTKGDPHGHHF